MKTNKYLKVILAVLCSSLILSSCGDDDGNPVSVSATVYASNNSNGNITAYDVSDMSSISSKTFLTLSTAADGVYYDGSSDNVFQASRSGLRLEGFTGISAITDGASITQSITGSNDMQSPRELAVSDNFFVVADNQDVDGDLATLDGRLFVYQRSGSSLTLRNIITTDFKLWGITFIGSDLYAVVDADNELAVYTNFLSNSTNSTLSASKRVVIEGIVRTHGITYDASSNIMVMTDIGSATNTQDDGGFQIISNFTSKFSAVANGGTLALSDQVRVSGASTLMGNPVDVAYYAATGTVFIAEAGNGGGRILSFTNIGSGGNLTPVMNSNLAAASSVFLYTE
jgi:hypothetical protein